MVNKVSGKFQVKGENMHAYMKKVTNIMKSFKKVVITQISRLENTKVDALAKLALTLQGKLPTTILVEILN